MEQLFQECSNPTIQKSTSKFSSCHEPAYEHHRSTQSWRLKNNPRGVGDLVCPEHSVSNSLTSDMSPTRKITITSQKCIRDPSLRKPVKDCYCYSGANNINKPKLNKATRDHNKDLIEIPPISIDDYNIKNISTPPLSCETLRKFQQINYTPTSEFLRRIQSKLSVLENGGDGICSNEGITNTACKQTTTSNELPKHLEKLHKYTSTSELLKQTLIQDEGDDLIELYAHPKPEPTIIKKTLSSKKSNKEESNSIPIKKKTSNLLPDDSICCKCVRDRVNCKRCCNSKSRCSHYNIETDDEMKDLRKFREQNYFDTHGSNHTLTSGSLGTVHQYLLNERLFPEFVGSIDKRDLLLTTPFCATKQNNRIHYFPRYIVPQVKPKPQKSTINHKNQCNHRCPLTGHSIDLGVLKISLPSNSLALKYQKRPL